jgi:DNA-binding MarR family transcriptional regulator
MPGLIAQRLQQRRNFRTIEEEVWVGLQLTADRLTEPWARVLREQADLTLVQYNVLRILRGAGTEGLLVGEVAGRLITRSPDVTRIVDRLERQGLARRTPDEADRRAVRVHLTEAGRERIAPLDAQIREAVVDLFRDVGSVRLEAFRDTLEAILEGLDRRTHDGLA